MTLIPLRFLLSICAAAGLSRAADLIRVQIPATVDGATQNAMWYAPPEAQSRPVPLLIALHSWSSDYTQKDSQEYVKRCAARGWALVFPDFRGVNRTPLACGSDAAVSDVVDAVTFAKRSARIDPKRIYLAGVSGGGYMSLLMAARHPHLWTAVSAWVPIADLAEWYGETKARGLHYPPDMDSVFGGPPGTDAKIDAEYRRRSPLFLLSKARGLPVDINAGIHDGHTGSVPVSHSLRAFNALARANGFQRAEIPEADIARIVTGERIPESLGRAPSDPTYSKPVLFRREARPARVTLFEGTHEMLMDAAFSWLEKQRR